MSKFAPTLEQEKAVNAFSTGDDMIIEAFAGAGKTSTLTLLAEDVGPQDKLIYIAYNKAIATDAQASFPNNTICKTAHSFAFGAVGKNYAHRLKGPRMTARDTANILGIKSSLELDGDVVLSSFTLARMVKDTVQRFCYSADKEIDGSHVPYTAGVDMNALRSYILPLAKKMWRDAEDKNGRLKFEHDYYLKMWTMMDPRLPGDAILLDEAQDANPCIAAVVTNQRHAQKVMVGDRFQQLYAWRGAVDAMQNFKAKQRVFLTQSFRFGDAVAEEANKWLTLLGSEVPLHGFDKIESRLDKLGDDADAVLCRTNAGVVSQALAAQAAEKKVAIVGGTNEILKFAEAAEDLMMDRRTSHPDLVAFKNWAAVKDYVEEEGSDLKTLVNMVDSYGVDAIKILAATAVNEDRADIIFSTGHKSKGREWSTVRIATDFSEPEPKDDGSQGDPNKADMMLCYVCTTRAMNVLDNEGIAWVDRYITKEPADGTDETDG